MTASQDLSITMGPMTENARTLVRAAERGPEHVVKHPYNPRSEIHGVLLSRQTGLRRAGVNLARIPPGKESFAYHLHHVEEEWMFVLSGRGVADVGDEALDIAPGDFLGFPPGGPAHHVRNTGAEDLVYLVGGESREIEVGDFPKLGLRMVRLGDPFAARIAVYRVGTEVPFAPPAGGGA